VAEGPAYAGLVAGLGEVLEVIFARPDAAVAMHAVVHERRDPAVARRAYKHSAKQLPDSASPTWIRVMTAPLLALEGLGRIAEKVRREPQEPVSESELAIWLDASGRVRLERTWSSPEGAEQVATVVTTMGDELGLREAWRIRRDPQARYQPTAIDARRLFDRELLRETVSCLVLEAPHEGEVAGRQVVLVDGVLRQPYWRWPHALPFGAERYELAFDCEFGSLLAFRARAEDSVYEEVAVTEITYGGPVDQHLLAAS
jgi:hypothetical protein